MVPAIRRVDVIVDIDLVLRNRRLLACVLFDLSSKYITKVYRVRKEYQYGRERMGDKFLSICYGTLFLISFYDNKS